MPLLNHLLKKLLLMLVIILILSGAPTLAQVSFQAQASKETQKNPSETSLLPQVYDADFWRNIYLAISKDSKKTIAKLKMLIIQFEQEQDFYNLTRANSKIGYAYSFIEEPIGLAHTQTAISLAQEHNFPALESEAHTVATFHYVDMQQFDKAQDSVNKALALATKQGDKIWQYNALSALYWFQFFSNNLQGALETMLRRLKLAPEVNRNDTITTLLNNIASVYGEIGQFDQSLVYFQKSLDLNDEKNDPYIYARTLSNIAKSYQLLERYSEAEKSLKEAQKVAETIDDSILLASIDTQFGGIANAKGNYDQGLKYFQNSLTLLKKRNSAHTFKTAQMGLADTYLKLGLVRESIEALEKVLPVIKESNQDNDWMDYYDLVAQAQEQLGDTGKALAAYKKFTDYMLKEQEKNSDKDLTQMQVKFDTEQVKKDNVLLQKDNALMTTQQKLIDVTLRKERKTSRLLTSTIILSVIITVIIILSLIKSRRSRERYHDLAMRDELTKAPNRRAIQALAEKNLVDTQHGGDNFLLALADIDFFKNFNDTYGHDTGDMVLIKFAQALSSALRSADTLGRFGGEEWLIVMPQAEQSELDQIFSRLQQASKAIRVDGVPEDHLITFSMGVVSAQGHKGDVDALIKQADINLYKAKDAGRDQFQC
jgi:diguanylate cyclase (GGDEF)-like protein